MASAEEEALERVECRRLRAGEGFEECWGDDVAYRKTVGEALVEADKAGDVLSIICGAWSSCLSSVRRFVDVSRGVFGCQSAWLIGLSGSGGSGSGSGKGGRRTKGI